LAQDRHNSRRSTAPVPLTSEAAASPVPSPSALHFPTSAPSRCASTTSVGLHEAPHQPRKTAVARLPPLKGPTRSLPSPRQVGRELRLPKPLKSLLPPTPQAAAAPVERAEPSRTAAKARTAACFEDLISFIELQGLSGAYALAFSANGVQDLAHLLTMEDEALDRVIEQAHMDAMDEIMLRDALRSVRPSR